MFAPRIQIDADPSRFTFSSSHKTVSLEPFFYLSSDEPERILYIGERPSETRQLRYIHLFTEPVEHRDYAALLSAFVRHGMFSVRRWSFITLRPHVGIHVSHALAEYLRGYHAAILYRAALEAGARAEHIHIHETA